MSSQNKLQRRIEKHGIKESISFVTAKYPEYFKAKDTIIARMAEPPSLQELSDTIGLSLKKLKEGFKQIYGDTVYGFLFDYKMEVARKLLDSGDYNVNEVGFKVGYSTSSHFIAAFKKKYGTTPKKYIMASSK